MSQTSRGLLTQSVAIVWRTTSISNSPLRSVHSMSQSLGFLFFFFFSVHLENEKEGMTTKIRWEKRITEKKKKNYCGVRFHLPQNHGHHFLVSWNMWGGGTSFKRFQNSNKKKSCCCVSFSFYRSTLRIDGLRLLAFFIFFTLAFLYVRHFAFLHVYRVSPVS